MSVEPFSPVPTREALARLPDIAAQEDLTPPPLTRIYVPLGHQRALSLDATLVVGMRGAGKSLWTAVLQSDEHRSFVAAFASVKALERTVVRVGFGLDESNTRFPNAATLAKLAAGGVDPAMIWKTVVLINARNAAGAPALQRVDWSKTLDAAVSRPEETDTELAELDAHFAAQGKVLLVVFDALDRLGAGWTEVRTLLTGALRFALACRARRAIRLKFFLRPDMEEDGEIWKFPDSSKLRHGKVELEWRTGDLYALVLTYLGNDEQSGRMFRREATRLSSMKWPETDGLYPVPRSLLVDEDALRAIVEGVAGPWMGRSHKRGFTYTWIPTHLADAAGRMSPRSLLLAFKHAADISLERFAGHDYALHFEAIQQGVAQASLIRIAEIKEDYPWVEPLLEAARGLSVPCEPRDLTGRWTPECLDDVRTAGAKLAPRRFTTDPNRKNTNAALVDDLVELAVLYRTDDGRLNMPDIFRVGFGIKRKGGVKPPK
ncbi:hypothetical protein WME94_05570 [Sorangium sp. So ce429]